MAEQKHQEIIKKLGKRRVEIGEPLAKHTTFGIGGPADLFYIARSSPELVAAVNLARRLEVECFILGEGSNILVSDSGFRGLVIKVEGSKYKVFKEDSKNKITVEAGMKLADLVLLSKKLGLRGLEFLVGIPGTVGGAVKGNAGAWQKEIGDRVDRIRVLGEEDQATWIKKGQCQFSYRDSRFKKTNEVILQVKFVLKKGDRKMIDQKIRAYLLKKSQQPKLASAGCVFINPKDNPAGMIIDQCGLKGRIIGKARISPDHANFIVNLGGAKASDVLKLINLAKKEVKKKFDVELEEEIDLVGFSAKRI